MKIRPTETAQYTIDYLEEYCDRKSFYKKCHAVDMDGGFSYLVSYDTIVCSITSDGRFVRHWPRYSATTLRHVSAFRRRAGLPAIGKKEWESLTVERF